MYIYTEIEIQTNTHIPITPPPPPIGNTAAHPRIVQSSCINTHKKNRSGDTISTNYYRK